jgi:hypothetical protein
MNPLPPSGWMMNSKARLKNNVKRSVEKLNEREREIRLEKPMTTTEIQEKTHDYTSKGWTRVDGSITLGFVSRCGEYFNCFDLDSGRFYSFGTDLAYEIYCHVRRWGRKSL